MRWTHASARAFFCDDNLISTEIHGRKKNKLKRLDANEEENRGMDKKRVGGSGMRSHTVRGVFLNGNTTTEGVTNEMAVRKFVEGELLLMRVSHAFSGVVSGVFLSY